MCNIFCEQIYWTNWMKVAPILYHSDDFSILYDYKNNYSVYDDDHDHYYLKWEFAS